MARQFGSLGKKLKKNLGKLARNSSFKNVSRAGGDCRQQQQQQYTEGGSRADHQRLMVSASQNYILSAFIHTSQNSLPYQNEMIENYLQVGKIDF